MKRRHAKNLRSHWRTPLYPERFWSPRQRSSAYNLCIECLGKKQRIIKVKLCTVHDFVLSIRSLTYTKFNVYEVCHLNAFSCPYLCSLFWIKKINWKISIYFCEYWKSKLVTCNRHVFFTYVYTRMLSTRKCNWNQPLHHSMATTIKMTNVRSYTSVVRL